MTHVKKQSAEAKLDMIDVSDFECCVCLEVQPPPWFTCPECGKLTCGKCFSQLRGLVMTTCPMCRATMALMQPNVGLERVAIKAGVRVPCKHEGCVETCTLDMLRAHEEESCPCRPQSQPQQEEQKKQQKGSRRRRRRSQSDAMVVEETQSRQIPNSGPSVSGSPFLTGAEKRRIAHCIVAITELTFALVALIVSSVALQNHRSHVNSQWNRVAHTDAFIPVASGIVESLGYVDELGIEHSRCGDLSSTTWCDSQTGQCHSGSPVDANHHSRIYTVMAGGGGGGAYGSGAGALGDRFRRDNDPQAWTAGAADGCAAVYAMYNLESDTSRREK